MLFPCLCLRLEFKNGSSSVSEFLFAWVWFGCTLPIPKAEEIPCKGSCPMLGEVWRAWAAAAGGSGFSSAAAPSKHSAVLSWSPATLAMCPLGVSMCGAVSVPPAGGQPPAGHLHTKNPSGGKSHCRGGSSEPHSGLQVSTEVVGIALIPRGSCAVWTRLQGSARQNRLLAGTRAGAWLPLGREP